MLDRNTGRLATLGVDKLKVRNVDAGLLLDDAALGLLGVRLGVLLDHIDTFDDHAILTGIHGKDLTGLSLVVTGIYINGIAFLDMQLFHIHQRLKDLRCQ